MLGVEPSADVETIKKAFRREIARYHPDKVTHLGQEFQEMASSRAAELTSAYKILSDADARAEYDELVLGNRPAPAPPSSSAATSDRSVPHSESVDEPTPQQPETGSRRFQQERAGRDDIMRRAVLARLRQVLEQVVGVCDTAPIRGFDLACVAKGRPSLFRRTVPPSVLVRLAPLVDGPVATQAWLDAIRARIEQKPVILLLIGDRLAPANELARAIDEQRRKTPALADSVFPVPVDLRDWSARMPANAPESARLLIEKLKNFVG